MIGRPSGWSASISRTWARIGFSSRLGSPAVRTASVTLGGTENGVREQDGGQRSLRRPSFRVLAMTPTMVTSGGGWRRSGRPAAGWPARPSRSARADRVLARGPQLERGFVDHGDAVAAPDFGGVEHPPGAQRNAECAQVIRADQVDADPLRVVRVLPDDSEWGLRGRRTGARRSRLDARQGIDRAPAIPARSDCASRASGTWQAAEARRRSGRARR